jgi:hypothetical protein
MDIGSDPIFGMITTQLIEKRIPDEKSQISVPFLNGHNGLNRLTGKPILAER